MNETQEAKPEVEKQNPSGPASFWSELKRRHVIRVAGVYSVVAWLVIQVAGATFESFGIPIWAFRFVVLMLVLGLPVSLVLAWAMELTPEGIKLVTERREIGPDTADPASLNKKRRRLSVAFAAALPTLIFGTLALVFYLQQGDRLSVDPVTPPISAAQSIAVLPLINMSDIDANAFFASGVHEDILTNLSRINGLQVISRTSVMRFINSEMSMRDIGLALGVNYIVEGSVRRINNHVRVTVQLIDARNDTHLWANNYDRELVDVFATQSAVAREISNSLHLEIQPKSVGTLQGMPTHSVKAYDLYLKARSIERSEPVSEAGLIRQQEYLEEALQEDPDFVEAWAVLNEVYDNKIETMGRLGWFVPPGGDSQAIYNDFFEKSVYALKKAMALDPENMETLIARAAGAVGEDQLNENVATGDLSNLRRKMMDYTIEKYPDSAMAWYVRGWWHFSNANDIEAAKVNFQKALELDPFHARIVGGALDFYHMVADEAMVAMLYDRLAQISPEKGSDRSLGQVGPVRKFSALESEFALTADQSLIEPMSEILSSPGFSTLDSIDVLKVKSELFEIQNDQHRLTRLPLESLLQADYVIEQDANSGKLSNYLVLLSELLRQHRASGVPDKATQTAEQILHRLEDFPRTPQCEDEVDMLSAEAYATLGQQDEAWVLVNKLMNEQSHVYNPYGFRGYAAFAMLDPDRAAERMLEQASNPGGNVMDWFALYHLTFRDVLVHPDIQAYYVKQGKWIDYLAERVPEYEQCRK
jgi:TolB-like protein